MLDIKQMNSYGNVVDRGISHIKCSSCERVLKVNQINRKEIDDTRDFVILIYYCMGCDSYILIFKASEKKKGRSLY